MKQRNRNTDWPYWLLCIFVLAAIVYAHQAKAETNVFIGAWSKHLVTGGDHLNEQHDLFAVEHNSVIAGRFVNSYNRETYFGAYKWAWRYKGLSAGVYGGLMHGYTKCYGDDGSSANVCPMAAPYITWDAGPINPQIMLFGEALAVTIRVGF